MQRVFSAMAGSHTLFPTSPQAFLWQLDFAAAPDVLKDLDHLLKVDERVVRSVVLRRSAFAPLPNTYAIAKRARRLLLQQEAQASSP